MRVANEHASAQLTRAARRFREYVDGLTDRDAVAREALASLVRTVGSVALAAQLLSIHMEQAGNVELPREISESPPYRPHLSWVLEKLRALAGQVARVIAAGEAPPATEGGEGE